MGKSLSVLWEMYSWESSKKSLLFNIVYWSENVFAKVPPPVHSRIGISGLLASETSRPYQCD